MRPPALTHPSAAVFLGDCLDVLAEMPDDSVDAIVCDPPYGLGFMGQKWDTYANETGRAASTKDHKFDHVGGNHNPSNSADASRTRRVEAQRFGEWCSLWTVEALRVLKPGGHLLAFGGTRTWHRLAVAVEDAGFEVRDSIAWLYGSGFPKSLDVSKAVDKVRDDSPDVRAVCARLASERDRAGITNVQMDEACGLTSGGASASHWTAPTTAKQPRVPTWEQWESLRRVLAVSDPALDAELWRLNGRKGTPGEAWDAREVVDQGYRVRRPSDVNIAGPSSGTYDITAPATPAAQQWAGWGTALKPAFEPIVVARKPLTGTVAANVLAHGTGALNIDGCRVPGEVPIVPQSQFTSGNVNVRTAGRSGEMSVANAGGRWPANVLLDGDAAAELDADNPTTKGRVGMTQHASNGADAILGARRRTAQSTVQDGAPDEGGVSRYFPTFKYQAKAPTRERPSYIAEDGTKTAHPTVKPLALMRWLVRLVTPPGGTVLDTFAGSGATIEAAIEEGFFAFGIEREESYLPLIQVRLDRTAAPDDVTNAEAVPGSRYVPEWDSHGRVLANERAARLNDDGLMPWER